MIYENLLFDLGGVILNVHYERTADAFRKLGVTDFDRHFTQFKSSELFEQLERGEVDEAEFLEAFRAQTGLQATDEAIVEAWNAMLGELPADRLQLLSRLSRHYRLFLLSNTNIIHLKGFYQIVADQYGIDFDRLFEGSHYSHELGARKPEPEAFRRVVSRHRLNPHRTLFIDDSQPNLDGARKAGLRVQIHPSNQDLKASIAYLLEA